MHIDPEVLHENIESQLRTGGDEDAVRVGVGMVQVKIIADPEIEPEGVELRHRPDRIDVELRADDDVILLVSFGEIDVVVVFDPERHAETEADRADEEIVWDLLDGLTARFGRGLTS